MAATAPPEFYFAAALRRARTEAGLNQEELALRIGVHASEISSYESGKRSPQLWTIHRLAEGLKVHAWQLLWLAAQIESGAPWEEITWPPVD